MTGKAVHCFAEGRKLRSIYSARAFHRALGDRDLASFSVHGPQMIFRGKITVFNSCHQAATQLGLGRRGGVGAPILAALDQKMAVG